MNDRFEELLGRIVGHGSQATVYAKGDFAVKLYREGYPKGNVFSEAYIMSNLERENFPSPKIYEVLLLDGRYGLRMDLVKGKPMSAFAADPETCKKVIDTLVGLQWRLQKEVKTGDWTPDIKVRLGNDLKRNARLSDDVRRKLLDALEALPNDTALCHCDFHASNVFFDGEKYTIIDLLQICKGDPAADVVCSYVSYCMYDREIAEYYLARFCDVSKLPAENVRKWLPVYAGTLLGQVPEEYTPLIEGFIAGDDR